MTTLSPKTLAKYPKNIQSLTQEVKNIEKMHEIAPDNPVIENLLTKRRGDLATAIQSYEDNPIKTIDPTTFEKYGYLLIVIGVLLVGVGILMLILKPKPKDPADPKAMENAESKAKMYQSIGIASIVVGALLGVVYVWKYKQ